MENIQVVKEPISLQEITNILNKAIESGAEVVEYEGVLNDNYIIYDAGEIRISNEEPTEYIIFLAEFANTWADNLYMIRTNDEQVVQYYEEIFQ